MSKDEILSAIRKLKSTIPHPIDDGQLGHDRYLQKFFFFLQQIRPTIGPLTPLLSGKLESLYDVPERGDACGSGIRSDQRLRVFFCENFPPFLTLLKDWVILRFESSSMPVPKATTPYPKEVSITEQIVDLKKRIPKPDEGLAQYSSYRAELEVFLTRMKQKISEELYKELHTMLQNIFSENYFFPEFGLPDEWHGGRLGYKEKRSLTPDELKHHRIKGLEEFFAVAQVKVLAACEQLGSSLPKHNSYSMPLGASKENTITSTADYPSAPKETELEKPIFTMGRDSYGRVFINETLVATPVAGGDTDILMVKLLIDKKDELDLKDIAEIKNGGNRTISKIITDLGFRGSVRNLFFSSISDKKLVFHRQVYSKDLEKGKITQQHVLDQLSQSKKVEVSRKESK